MEKNSSVKSDADKEQQTVKEENKKGNSYVFVWGFLAGSLYLHTS